jgi:Nuclease-related domain
MPASSSLRGRVPGQVAMSEVIAAQLDVPSRSRLGRLFGKSPLTPATRPVYRAALGELLVGDMLDNLGPRWDVLHVVPVDTDERDLDHLVIGPPGVFTISTENFPGQEFRVNGEALSVGNRQLAVGSRQLDHILMARRLGERAAERLSAAAGRPVEVTPLLVAVTPTRLVLREAPRGVGVVTSKQLLHFLERQDTTLSGMDVAYISDIADRHETWQTSADLPQDPQKLGHSFAVLRTEVQEAAQARLFWVVVGLGSAAICVWLVASMLTEHLMGN